MSISNGSGSPGPFKPGQSSIDSGMLNKMWASMNGNKPGIMGSGLLARMTPGGTLIDPAPVRRVGAPRDPFVVYPEVDSTGNMKFKVVPGTINNVMPVIDGKTLDDPQVGSLATPTEEGENFMIVVKCMGEKNKRFPKDKPEVKIVTATEAQTDTDEYGYFAIASLYKNTATGGKVTWHLGQLVKSSVWAERRKFTEPNTAFYYFTRV